MKTPMTCLLAAIAFVSIGDAAARADAVADFYRGKQISMIVPSGVGGGYDLYSRFLSRYYGKFIPGQPSFVVKNLPGAGGITAANNLYSVAVPDGLTMGIFQNTVTLNQLAGMSSVKFDVRKFSWIGNMSIASTICAMSGPAKQAKAEDLFTHEYVIGATSGSPNMIPLILNNLAGTKFKIVNGYVSTSNVQLAMESGEVAGMCGWSWDGARVNGRDMFARDSARVVIDIAIQPQPELQKMGVPFLMDMVPEGENKEALKVILSTQVYNRPFAAPPGIPADRLAALRKAFAETLDDQEFKTEAEKLGLDVAYLPPEKILDLINLALGAPPKVQAKAVDELSKAGF
jgi:tripartite-type tricarboxylate transporter receptor subunit TctC